MPVDAGEEAVASDVELSFVDQERVLNVFLKNSCLVLAGALISDDVADFVELLSHYNA